MPETRLLAEGHLVDSGILTRMLNLITEEKADYEIVSFRLGKTNSDFSQLELEVRAGDVDGLATLLPQLINLGCYEKEVSDALLAEAPAKGVAPSDFYATTNHRTELFAGGTWRQVKDQRMDAVIVRRDGELCCVKIRDLLKGEPVVCGSRSIRLFPQFRERESGEFGFMQSDLSSEKSTEISVERVAARIRQEVEDGGRVVAAAGPVVVHTGGAKALAGLIRRGYIHGLLSGDALAVHDVESVFFGTSLGVDLTTGRPTYEGHKNHLRAINRIRAEGSLHAAVERGILSSGIMFEAITKSVPFVLAGSIRDDGPIPETVTDMIVAQRGYEEVLKGATLVLMLSTMLHSIAVGNMIPSAVKTVCVDINPAVVTKLTDRGSAQTVGIVTDVGLFLNSLARKLGVETTE